LDDARRIWSGARDFTLTVPVIRSSRRIVEAAFRARLKWVRIWESERLNFIAWTLRGRTDYSPGETDRPTAVLRTLCCFASLRLGVSRSARERQGPSDAAVSALSAPFFRPSWRFEFIAPRNAGGHSTRRRQDAKTQRAYSDNARVVRSSGFSNANRGFDGPKLR